MDQMTSRNFMRSSAMYMPLFAVAGIFCFLGLAAISGGKIQAGVFILFLGSFAGYVAYWGKSTPYVRVAGEKIIIRPALLWPAKVINMNMLGGLESPNAEVVYVAIKGSGKVKIHLTAVSRYDRDPLMAYLLKACSFVTLTV